MLITKGRPKAQPNGLSLTVPKVLTNLFKGIEAIDNKIKTEIEDKFIFWDTWGTAEPKSW